MKLLVFGLLLSCVALALSLCPSVREHCPSVKEHCPSVKEHCPSVKEHCPSVKEHCPSLKEHCPSVKEHCPSLKEHCSLKHCKQDSQSVKEDCPSGKEDCQSVKENCPSVKEDCLSVKENYLSVKEDCPSVKNEGPSEEDLLSDDLSEKKDSLENDDILNCEILPKTGRPDPFKCMHTFKGTKWNGCTKFMNLMLPKMGWSDCKLSNSVILGDSDKSDRTDYTSVQNVCSKIGGVKFQDKIYYSKKTFRVVYCVNNGPTQRPCKYEDKALRDGYIVLTCDNRSPLHYGCPSAKP